MTEESLKRGEEIRSDLRTLLSALSEVQKGRMFSIDVSGAGCYGRMGDPFLSDLHVQLQTQAVRQINAKIKQLEKEFASL